MRRILITDKVKGYAEEYASNLFKDRNANFKLPCKNLELLSDALKANHQDEYVKYVEKIILFYPRILTLLPTEFEPYRVKHFANLNEGQLSAVVPGYTKHKNFYESVVGAMRYDAVQSTEIRPYMKKLGIKAFVYCNAAYAVATDDNKATFQVDHYYPKSKYPFLCTSFFNLFPSCMHCNQIKSKNTGYDYCLYTEDPARVNPFYFTIDDKSIVKYMLTHNSEVLKFKLNGNPVENADSHSSFFHLAGLYPQFSDAAEEVIWKAKIFDKTYQAQLMKAYMRKFPYKMDDFKRFYLGFYPDEKDVNMRPLTLLMQGIAKDMNLE